MVYFAIIGSTAAIGSLVSVGSAVLGMVRNRKKKD
jgi:hypothetical protein